MVRMDSCVRLLVPVPTSTIPGKLIPTRLFFSDSQVENIFFDLKSKIFDLSSRKFSNLQSLPVLFRWQFSLSRKFLPNIFDLKPKIKQIRLGKSKIFAKIFDLKSKISNFRLGKSKIFADFFFDLKSKI